ncbi:hypothetical protein N7541_005103 [Penicillium brevicompactum]|uniref:Uncharacterized protein n=1 Tax=Penicillium brevicompactum TaxID=5074 RepID=A0A9W9REB1_PENBR|nr:hypothetical protein N7541_005103 [Penicillium brevicompactum]
MAFTLLGLEICEFSSTTASGEVSPTYEVSMFLKEGEQRLCNSVNWPYTLPTSLWFVAQYHENGMEACWRIGLKMVAESVSFAEAEDLVFNNEYLPNNAMEERVKRLGIGELLSVELSEYVAGNCQVGAASVASALYDVDE